VRKHFYGRGGEFLLALGCSVGLTAAIASGFELEDVWSGRGAVILLLSALVLALCDLAAYRRWLTGVAIALGLGGGVSVVVYCQSHHPLTEESANSTFLYLLITLLTALLTYLFSRSRLGSVALFLGSILLTAGASFLQFPVPLWSVILSPAAALGLYLCRSGRLGSGKAQVGMFSPRKSWVQSLALCLISLALAGGIYGGIIRPLNPPTQELKLVTVLRSMESLRVLGVSSTRTVLEEDLTSTASPEEQLSTNQQEENQQEDTPTPTPTPENGQLEDDTQTGLTAVSYETNELDLRWLLLLLIPLGILAVCLLALWRRKHWQRKVEAMEPEQAVLAYYQHLLKKLARMGIRRPEGQTLRRFAQEQEEKIAPFRVGHHTFLWLTQQYEAVFYGGITPSPETLRGFRLVDQQLYPNLRKELGPVAYYLKGFWL
jgi:hypothetical protein